MAGLNVKGTSYALSSDDRLVDVSAWTSDVAEAMAHKEGLTLTAEHWQVIDLMREFYQRFNISPVRKLLKKSIAEKYGPDKATEQHLLHLFPNDILIQGTRIAGIPVPLLDAELEQSTYTKGADSTPAETGHFIDQFEFDDKVYKVFPRGNLVNPDEWNESLAAFMAMKEGMTLTAEHWEVINYLRRFYFQFGISPMVKLLMKHMAESFGSEKSSEQYLYRLFPGGPARQGSRIAGLPEPQGCVDP